MSAPRAATSLVLTTIGSPNNVMRSLAQGAARVGWDFLIIGDKKSPSAFNLDGAEFFSLEEQNRFGFELSSHPLFPTNHYSRKNIGFLLAISRGALNIVETDDDNFPLKGFFRNREACVLGRRPLGDGWVNVYKYFTDSLIWPRGFPLDKVKDAPPGLSEEELVSIGISQGLAQDNPDVDAVFRLTRTLPFSFNAGVGPIVMGKQHYCPTNSQNTTHFAKAFPLLYLPSFCSFRMTDIWRGLISQRVLAETEHRVVFEPATVRQERNEHDLMKDFREEVDGYLGNVRLVDVLNKTILRSGVEHVASNLLACYESLVSAGFFPEDELHLLHAWLQDCGANSVQSGIRNGSAS